MRRAICAAGAVLLGGCPPPEVLYGPEVFDETAPDATVPTLPSARSSAPASDGTLVQVKRSMASKVGPAPHTLAGGPHVTFSGTIRCNGCTERLMLHVVALDATGAPPPPDHLAGGLGRTPLVSAEVSVGPFAVVVPKVDVPVSVELLVDVNRDGIPSMGERYVQVLDPATPLRTDTDRTGFLLDASDRPMGRDRRSAGPRKATR